MSKAGNVNVGRPARKPRKQRTGKGKPSVKPLKKTHALKSSKRPSATKRRSAPSEQSAFSKIALPRSNRRETASPDSLHLMLGTLEVVAGKRDEMVVSGSRTAGWRKRGRGFNVLKWSGTPGRSLVARALAAAGEVHRLTILETLLDGPAVYRTLQKVTNLKAGPLYHHIHQLRLASLILPKQRDLYELTRAGRNLTLITLGLEKLVQDDRRRPMGLIEADE